MPTSIYAFGYRSDALSQAVATSSVPWNLSEDSLATSNTPLLRGVDRHDDTTFNQLQCRHLMSEIQFLRTQDLTGEQTEMLDELARLVSVVIQSSPHHYLRFNGD